MIRYILIILLTIAIGCQKSGDNIVEVIPLAPTELKAFLITNDQIKLEWKDNSTNETGYKIERKTDITNFKEIGSITSDITTYTDNSVLINTNYTYRVYSYNKVGKSLNYSNEAKALFEYEAESSFTSKRIVIVFGQSSVLNSSINNGL